MDEVLHIVDSVVTEEVLRRRHDGETDVHICTRAVITPTGWDFIRDQRLQVTRVERAALLSGGAVSGPPSSGGSTAVGRSDSLPGNGSDAIQEIRPVTDGTSLIQQGRCDFPGKSFGCKTEEFGSGFVEPSTCEECSVQRGQSLPASPVPGEQESGCGCGGCNRDRTLRQVAGEGGGSAVDLEVLVQRITEEIMSRLGSS